MAASLLFFSVAATASVIDFNTLTGANGSSFSTYSENGFTVTAIQGSWSKGFVFGNPAPNIYCDRCAPGVVAITADSGLFTFTSVDLANSQSSSVDSFTIEGFRLGSVVFSQSGSLIFQNDNWRSDQEAQIVQSGMAPSAEQESAIIATLPAGNYTAVARGVGGSEGVALVEIFALD